MLQRSRIAAGQIDIFPESHIFIRGGGIPVHPGDREIIFLRREYFNGQGICTFRMQSLADVKGEGSESSRNILCITDLLAIQPDIRAIVQGMGMRDLDFLLGSGPSELGAKPPEQRKGLSSGIS